MGCGGVLLGPRSGRVRLHCGFAADRMHQRQILIVDDDDLLSEMLKPTPELEGFAVTTALNGAEGLDQVRPREFDLVVLDLGFRSGERRVGKGWGRTCRSWWSA